MIYEVKSKFENLSSGEPVLQETVQTFEVDSSEEAKEAAEENLTEEYGSDIDNIETISIIMLSKEQALNYHAQIINELTDPDLASDLLYDMNETAIDYNSGIPDELIEEAFLSSLHETLSIEELKEFARKYFIFPPGWDSVEGSKEA